MPSEQILFREKLFKEEIVSTHLIKPHPFFDIKSVLMTCLLLFCDLDRRVLFNQTLLCTVAALVTVRAMLVLACVPGVGDYTKC